MAETGFAWTRIYETVEAVVHHRCYYSKVDNSPGNTRCLLPTSKAVRHNKSWLDKVSGSLNTSLYHGISESQLRCKHTFYENYTSIARKGARTEAQHGSRHLSFFTVIRYKLLIYTSEINELPQHQR